MAHRLTGRERALYLARKKAQVLHRLCLLLAGITAEDVLAMSLAEQRQLAAVLDRLPDEIPAALIAALRVALAETGVAA
jgi:hypothetical protein